MESIPVYSRFGQILSDIDTSRISDLTQNIDILRTTWSMVDGKLDINATNEDGVTLFYLAIHHQEWAVAEYLLNVGADPKLVPPKDRPKVWRMRLLDFDGDQSFFDRLELRIGWLQILQELGVLEAANNEFIKRLLFVDRFDLKELNESIIKLLSENDLSRVKDLFESCCNNDWIDIYASVIKNRFSPKVKFTEFCYAFEHGSFDFFRMLCSEDIDTLGQLGEVKYSFKFLKAMVSQNRNEEKINFMLNFIITNNLEDCCRALFREAALNGCSDLVEKTLMMYSAEVFDKDINDDLIDEMFYTCGTVSCQNTKQVDRYTGYVDCLKLIITRMAPRDDKTIDVCQIFQQRDIQVIAEAIRENRFDIVEQMFRNHDFRQFSTDEYVSSIYSSTPHNSRINLMCCAISCADYGMIEFLTRKGMDISRISCRNVKKSIVISFPPLFCGLIGLLNLNYKACETVDESKVLENIKNIVKDFAGNFTGITRSARDLHARRSPRYCCGRRSPIACHETETSQTTTVLDIIISGFNKYSKRFILELLTFFLDFCNFSLNVPLSDKLSMTDFLVRNQEVEDRLFYLFQAGVSPELIRNYAKHFRNYRTIWDTLDIYTSKEYYCIHHCEALVFERNKDFLEIDFEGQYAEMKSKIDYVGIWDSVNSEHLATKLSQLGGFLEWYRCVTSSPFTLQNECRTMIRKSLIEASNHRSILKRIELLHLPKELKKYLVYE